ncbi:hypothetical protein EYC84_002391 [Monilinia fructicola]|uniref:Uncharacterized protein n=1 Tax=Monilinia fructicola TaxID=38448 RepID=A0A5M9JQH7_MONFR|nr:hypothetical protein EYC84_002391 [Monilinia fructicola]
MRHPPPNHERSIRGVPQVASSHSLHYPTRKTESLKKDQHISSNSSIKDILNDISLRVNNKNDSNDSNDSNNSSNNNNNDNNDYYDYHDYTTTTTTTTTTTATTTATATATAAATTKTHQIPFTSQSSSNVLLSPILLQPIKVAICQYTQDGPVDSYGVNGTDFPCRRRPYLQQSRLSLNARNCLIFQYRLLITIHFHASCSAARPRQLGAGLIHILPSTIDNENENEKRFFPLFFTPAAKRQRHL